MRDCIKQFPLLLKLIFLHILISERRLGRSLISITLKWCFGVLNIYPMRSSLVAG
jgi:hypothetical protein